MTDTDSSSFTDPTGLDARQQIADLIRRLRQAADQLPSERTAHDDLKILGQTLRELRRAFAVFASMAAIVTTKTLAGGSSSSSSSSSTSALASTAVVRTAVAPVVTPTVAATTLARSPALKLGGLSLARF